MVSEKLNFTYYYKYVNILSRKAMKHKLVI